MVYHDGGYTAPKNGAPEKSGWGYKATVLDTLSGTTMETREAQSVPTTELGRGMSCKCISSHK